MQRVVSHMQTIVIGLLEGGVSRAQHALPEVYEAVLCMIGLVVGKERPFLSLCSLRARGRVILVVLEVLGQHADVEPVEKHQAVNLVEGRDDVGVGPTVEDAVDGHALVGG